MQFAMFLHTFVKNSFFVHEFHNLPVFTFSFFFSFSGSHVLTQLRYLRSHVPNYGENPQCVAGLATRKAQEATPSEASGIEKLIRDESTPYLGLKVQLLDSFTAIDCHCISATAFPPVLIVLESRRDVLPQQHAPM